MAILKTIGDVSLKPARAYRIAGVSYAGGEEQDADFVKAKEYYKKAKEIFNRVLGMGNDESMQVNYNLALMMAEQQNDALGGSGLL